MLRVSPVFIPPAPRGQENERTIMGNVALTEELISVDELEELDKLDASESEPEDDEDDDEEEDDQDDEDNEGAKPDEIPHG
jgi:hypothetical protein